ncbi:MAG: hypothetical protein ACOCWM_00410 [Cyclobacteriaceae bacterium]
MKRQIDNFYFVVGPESKEFIVLVGMYFVSVFLIFPINYFLGNSPWIILAQTILLYSLMVWYLISVILRFYNMRLRGSSQQNNLDNPTRPIIEVLHDETPSDSHEKRVKSAGDQENNFLLFSSGFEIKKKALVYRTLLFYGLIDFRDEIKNFTNRTKVRTELYARIMETDRSLKKNNGVNKYFKDEYNNCVVNQNFRKALFRKLQMKKSSKTGNTVEFKMDMSDYYTHFLSKNWKIPKNLSKNSFNWLVDMVIRSIIEEDFELHHNEIKLREKEIYECLEFLKQEIQTKFY